MAASAPIADVARSGNIGESLNMRRFAKSVFLGTIAGAAFPLILTVPIGIINLISPMTRHRDPLGSLYIATLPLLISFGFVLFSSVLIGLPASALLKYRDAETERTYQTIGGVSGLMVPLIGLLIINATAGFWMCLIGAFSGIITAQTWWRSRPVRNGS